MLAALRSADLGARTALITRDEFGGMAANDGPVPVRTLAHAARLIREARQLGLYGIAVCEPSLDYPRLLARVHEVVNDVREHSALRGQIDSLRVSVYERAGDARFADPHTVETESGLRLQAEKIIICAGGERCSSAQSESDLASATGGDGEERDLVIKNLRPAIHHEQNLRSFGDRGSSIRPLPPRD